MVSYADGSVLAQLGNPDMRTPIAYGLAYPERMHAGVSPLDLTRAGALTFETPDLVRFPCLGLAFDALRAGGVAPVVLNAANEVAVDTFLQGRIRFTDIARIVGEVLGQASQGSAETLEGLLDADQDARRRAVALLDTAGSC
jgi:1-deoxy-D-xylulose-5-phosphate reductoisomerase